MPKRPSTERQAPAWRFFVTISHSQATGEKAKLELGVPRRWLLLLGLFVCFFLVGCDFIPKGATAFVVPGKLEYDKAQLAMPENALENQRPLKLKWLDTNTFMTTATLAPGSYAFTASTYAGGHYGSQVDVVAEKNKYELPERAVAPRQKIEGPKVTGHIVITPGTKPAAEVAVLFIGKQITMRRSPLVRGQWSANAPAKGNYRIEVHMLGDKPLSYVREIQPLNQDVDLGPIALK